MDAVLGMIRFFLSIKTYLWLSGFSILAFLAGSFYIPGNLEVFSEINDMPLFSWLSSNADGLDKFYWIYLLLCLMFLLGMNILICTLDAVIRKTTRGGLIEVLSPQVLHTGVIFVLLGQLVSSSTGYKRDIPLGVNDTVEIGGFNLTIKNMEFSNDQGEDSPSWRVYLKIDNEIHKLEPASPVFYRGTGFFVKSADHNRMKAIIGQVYDPGVWWEIIGAVMFVVGASGIFYQMGRKKAA